VKVIPHGNYNFFLQWKGSTGASRHFDFFLTPHTFVVLFFGIITKNKGLIHLIRAFQTVVRKIPNVKLLIAGEPYEDVSRYLQEIQHRELKDNIITDFRYIPIQEIPGYFERADVVVLPYIDTTVSGIIPVAYAFGRPVIVTNCGGLPEQVEHEKSGIIVPPGDEEKLAEAIIRVLQDQKLRTEMGKYASWVAEHKNSWEEIAKQTVELYQTL
jgi:glycosyltransferase involved in cell wall biosynthesis